MELITPIIVATMLIIAVYVMATSMSSNSHEKFRKVFGVKPSTSKSGLAEMEVISARVLQVLKELAIDVVSAEAEVWKLSVDIQAAKDNGMSAEKASELQAKAFELEAILRINKKNLFTALELAKWFGVVDKRSTLRSFRPSQEVAT